MELYKNELKLLSQVVEDTPSIQDVYTTDTQDRLGKDRLGKDNTSSPKRENVGISYLMNLSDEEVKILTATYKVTEEELREKAESLYHWAKGKNLLKRNFPSTLRGALLRDFGKRPGATNGAPDVFLEKTRKLSEMTKNG